VPDAFKQKEIDDRYNATSFDYAIQIGAMGGQPTDGDVAWQMPRG
jgi:hypothetical protein